MALASEQPVRTPIASETGSGGRPEFTASGPGYAGLPSISVIMPFYNCGGAFRSAIKGLTDLDYPHLELILIDDGSSDESSAIARSFCERTPRAVLLTNPTNMGAAEARNRGLKAATGEYVWFVDWDDEWSRDILLRLGRAVAESGADVAICRAVRIGADGKTMGLVEPFEGDRVIAGNEIVEAVLRGSIRGFLWTKLIRRDLISEEPFPRIETQEDFCGIVPVLARAEQVILLNSVLYRYQCRVGSLTSGRARNLTDFDRQRETMRRAAPSHYRPGRKGRTMLALRFDYGSWHVLKTDVAIECHGRAAAKHAVRAVARDMRLSEILTLAVAYPKLAGRALIIKLFRGAYPGLREAEVSIRRRLRA